MDNKLHPIQKDILTKLMQSEIGKKYAKLKGEDIENDLHNYHLQKLVKKEFIKKRDGLYELTERGSKFISQLSTFGVQKNYFKVSVALSVFRNDYTEILAQKRLRRPFYGDITTVAGKVHYGEAVLSAAKRKLLEETGLEADFKLIGTHRRIRRNKNNKVIEDTYYYYCVATDPKGEIELINSHGENFWMPSKEFINIQKNNVDTGPQDIQILTKFIKKDFSPFYLEQDVIVKNY